MCVFFFVLFFLGGGEGSDIIILFICLVFYFYFAYISGITVVCVVTDVLYMCLIHVKGIKTKNNNKK